MMTLVETKEPLADGVSWRVRIGQWLESQPERGIFWLTLIIYLAFWNPLYVTPMTEVSLDLAWSIGHKGSLELLGRHQADYVLVNGRPMSGVSPGSAFLAVPVASLAGFLEDLDSDQRLTALHMLVSLFVGIPLAALTASLLVRVIRLHGGSRLAAAATALLFALGTNQFAVALSYSKELISTCVVVAVLLCLSRPGGRAWPACLAGLWAGTLPVLHYSDALLTVAFGGFCWWAGGWRRLAWFGLGVLPALALLGSYHAIAFGSPWTTSYDFPRMPGDYYGWTNSPRDVAFQAFSAIRLGQILVGPYGFFMGNPLALVGLIGLWRMARRGESGRLALMGLVVFAVYALVYTMYRYDGLNGPFLGWRFLHLLLPLLLLGLPEVMATMSGRLVGVAAAYALVLSYLVAQAGYLVVGQGPWDKYLYMVKVWLTSFGGGVFFTDFLPRVLQVPSLHQHFHEVERLAASGAMRDAVSALLPLAATQFLFALVPLALWGAAMLYTGSLLGRCCRQEAVPGGAVEGRLAAAEKQP